MKKILSFFIILLNKISNLPGHRGNSFQLTEGGFDFIFTLQELKYHGDELIFPHFFIFRFTLKH